MVMEQGSQPWSSRTGMNHSGTFTHKKSPPASFVFSTRFTISSETMATHLGNVIAQHQSSSQHSTTSTTSFQDSTGTVVFKTIRLLVDVIIDGMELINADETEHRHDRMDQTSSTSKIQKTIARHCSSQALEVLRCSNYPEQEGALRSEECLSALNNLFLCCWKLGLVGEECSMFISVLANILAICVHSQTAAAFHASSAKTYSDYGNSVLRR